MEKEVARRTREEIARLASSGLTWGDFALQANGAIQQVIRFDMACWHPVDPGSVLFTGSITQNMPCSAVWLAEHEYVLDDFNKWHFLARSGYRAGSLSQATQGNLSLSARFRSGGGSISDELRGSFVIDGTYWGAAGFMRATGTTFFDDDEVRFLASLSSHLAQGFRRAFLDSVSPPTHECERSVGLLILDDEGRVESVSPAAEQWISELMGESGAGAYESHAIQAAAARLRARGTLEVPELPAIARAFTRSGRWLLLHGTRLSGDDQDKTAVIIQPAPSHEIASLIVHGYGLSERERQVTELCAQGLSTKEIAGALHLSPYTIQDHLKVIFEKTGTRTRAELVGRIFLDYYAPTFVQLEGA